MESRRISRIVLGTFGIVVVGLLLAQTIVIECEKTHDSQSNNDISCTLSNRLFGLISLNERRVLGVTGARLDRDEQGSNDVVYRVALFPSDGEVFPTIWYSSGDVSKRQVIDQINQFIQDPGQNTLRTSVPLISFWEKDTPLYLLLVAGILGYYAWKTWRENKKRSREVNVDDFIGRAASETNTNQVVSEDVVIEMTSQSVPMPEVHSGAGMPSSDSATIAINRWGGIAAVFLFFMIALLIPGLKVYTLQQEGYPIDSNLISKIDSGELTVLLILSGLMIAFALGFVWHTYRNWNGTPGTRDSELTQEEHVPQVGEGLLHDEPRKPEDAEDEKLKRIREDPHQVEVLSYLRDKLAPLGFIEEVDSQPLFITTTFRRGNFVVDFGYEYRDIGYFFHASQRNQPKYDIALTVNLDLRSKATDLKKIESFKSNVCTRFEKWVAEVGLISE